ncbi:MAG: response regulator transcription factor [Bryobacteraceae bacterium]|nr:response regulator transcription factor [Bryobacteraceae bacterium]
MARVLVIEDERHLADGLKFNLEAEGHEVELADSGEEGLKRVGESAFDLILLDIMLPGVDGFEVVSQLRAAANFVPVLMLTARGRAEDVLKGFEAGADDYLPKPFDLSILLARVRGLLRRRDWMTPAPKNLMAFDGKTVDFDNLEVRDADRRTPLTRLEAELLRYLMDRAGRTVSRKALLEEVWGVHEDTDTRAIDNFVVRLRRLIEPDPARPRHLLTVRGVGYRFEMGS